MESFDIGSEDLDALLNTTYVFNPENHEVTIDKMAYPMMICRIIMCILGCLGNTWFIYLIARYKKLKSTTNLLLTNLAAADLLYCLLMPLTIQSFLDGEYRHSSGACILQISFIWVAHAVVAMTLAVLTLDRCFSITKLLGLSGDATKLVPVAICIGIWVVAVLEAMPHMQYTQLLEANFAGQQRKYCVLRWPNRAGLPDGTQSVSLYDSLLLYILPAGAIIALALFSLLVFNKQSKRQRGATILVLVIDVLFLVLGAPYFIHALVIVFTVQNHNTMMSYYLVKAALECNNFIKPIVYPAVSPAFRRVYMLAVRCSSDADMEDMVADGEEDEGRDDAPPQPMKKITYNYSVEVTG